MMAPKDFSLDGAQGAGNGQPNTTVALPTPSAPPESDSGVGGGASDSNDVPGNIGGFTSDGGWGGGGMTNTQRPKPSPPIGGPQDTTGITPWGAQFLQNTGGFNRQLSFAEGGLVPDDDGDEPGDTPDHMSDLHARINQAIATVDNALSYGRKLHGLGGMGADGGGGDDMPASWNAPGGGRDYSGMRQSGNIDDRRDGDNSGEPPSGLARRVNNRLGEIGGRIDEFKAGYNPMSAAAGFNDIGSQRPKGVIPDDEEQ